MFDSVLNTIMVIVISQELKNKKLIFVYVLTEVCFFVFCGFVF